MFCIDAPDGLYISTTYCGSDNIFKPESSLTFKIYNGTGPYTYEVKDQGGVVIESGTVSESLIETTVFGLYAEDHIQLQLLIKMELFLPHLINLLELSHHWNLIQSKLKTLRATDLMMGGLVYRLKMVNFFNIA